jgi:hypothetical protein
MSKLEFEEGQILGVVASQEGSVNVVEVRHTDLLVGKREEFRSGNTVYCSKYSLPMHGEGIQYTFPGLKKELSD